MKTDTAEGQLVVIHEPQNRQPLPFRRSVLDGKGTAALAVVHGKPHDHTEPRGQLEFLVGRMDLFHAFYRIRGGLRNAHLNGILQVLHALHRVCVQELLGGEPRLDRRIHFTGARTVDTNGLRLSKPP